MKTNKRRPKIRLTSIGLYAKQTEQYLYFSLADPSLPIDLDGDGADAHPHQPFVFLDPQPSGPITIQRLYALYTAHPQTFRQDAYAVQSTVGGVRNLDELFAAFGYGDSAANSTVAGADDRPLHALWRCNRMHPTRLLRELIRRPSRLPRTGLHIERYVAVDRAGAPAWRLPDMECARVFVAQLAGGRTVVLRPSDECRGQCRTVQVRMHEGDVCEYSSELLIVFLMVY